MGSRGGWKVRAAVAAAVPLVSAVLLAGCCGESTQPPETPRPAGGDPVDPLRPLTPSEQRGKQIYRAGKGSSETPVTAQLAGSTSVPAAVLPCANCHGFDGIGKAEGGIAPSNIRWSDLTKPVAVQGDDRSPRRRPPYDDRLLKRSITLGRDSSGAAINSAMPRYQMSHQDLADLVAYMKRLGGEPQPGVTDDRIDIGVVLPPEDILPDVSRQLRLALTARIAECNEQGGVFGRTLKLRFEASAGRGDPTVAAHHALVNRPVFALLASFIATAESEVAGLAVREEIPLIGPVTLFPPHDNPPNPFVFHIRAGAAEQLQQLTRRLHPLVADESPRVLVAFRSDPALERIANMLVQQLDGLPVSTIGRPVKLPENPGELQTAIRQWQQQRAQILLVIANPDHGRRLLAAAAAAKWYPLIGFPGSLTDRAMFASTDDGFHKRLYVTFGDAPEQLTPRGRQRYQRWAKQHNLPPVAPPTIRDALAAADVLIEGLTRAGRQLTRDKLLEAVESLREFRSDFAPLIHYGPNRRIGAWGTRILTVDTRRKLLVEAVPWQAQGP